MYLNDERLVPHSDWNGPALKPWHIVANAKALVTDNSHIRRALDGGGTHVWVRYLGGKLVITVYNLQSDEPRLPVDRVIEGKGFWFACSRGILAHCLPVKGGLPKSLLTMIANVDY